MKHILYVIFTVFLITSCDDENLPTASWDLYELESLTATAGNKQVTLNWTASEKRTPDVFLVTWTSDSEEQGDCSKEVSGTENSTAIDGLVNRTSYTFTVQPVYGDKKGAPSSVSATPKSPYADVENLAAKPATGKITLTWTKPTEELGALEGYTITWTPGDGTAEITDPEMTKYTVGDLEDGTEYTFTIVPHYAGGDADGVSTTGTPGNTTPTWTSVSLTNGSYTGYVKTSNPVFSPDGGTMYIPTSNKKGDLFAIDVMSGNVKWVYTISNVTYGGGAAVGNDGTIYQGDQKGVIYAITSNGDTKWTYKTGGKIEGFPAITSDNILYIGAGESATSSLYAINGSTGDVLWKQTVDGNTASAVAVDADGNIYFGTNKAVYSFKSDGTARWTSSSLNVTERGSFALNGSTLYAALKSGAGVAAINTTSGSVEWTSGIATGDSYFPIIGTDGSIYFTDKGSQQAIALTANGVQKWATKVGVALVYAGMALAENGILYTGTQSKSGSNYLILGFNAATGNIDVQQNSSEQIMAAFTIGDDERVYYGTVAGNINAFDAGSTRAEGWSIRGGNAQGTNSLK